MSARIDMERAEAAHEARIEAGKERLRLAQAVLVAFAEGLGLADTARRVGRGQQTVWRIRVWLGLDTGRSWRRTGKRTGRLSSRAAVEGIRP